MILKEALTTAVQGILGAKKRFLGEFQDVVVAIADGKEQDAETLARILQDSGKSIDDLRQGVELVHRRRELRKQLDEAKAMEAERPGINKKIAEADRVFAQAEQVHSDTVDPLYWRLQQISDANTAATRARNELWNTCMDADLLAQLRDVTAEHATHTNRRSQLWRERDELSKAGESDLAEVAHAKSQTHAKDLRQRGEGRLARAKECDKEIARLDKKIAKLEQDEKAIREKMLQP